MTDETLLSVGKMASRAGVRVSALHFYERKGLIQSHRSGGNQRLFKKEMLRRVALIKAAQKLGISLEQIKAALAVLPENRTPTQQDWQNLASDWQQVLQRRIANLQTLSDLLTGCIGCGCLSMERCPIYNAQDKLGQTERGAVLLEQQWHDEPSR